MKITYQAEDGELFATEEACKKHESLDYDISELSPNCIFLDSLGQPLTHFETPDDIEEEIAWIYAPDEKSAEIIHNMCKKACVTSPWDEGYWAKFRPGYYWYDEENDIYEDVEIQLKTWQDRHNAFRKWAAN